MSLVVGRLCERFSVAALALFPMFVAFHIRGYMYPLKNPKIGAFLGCGPPDKGFRSVRTTPEKNFLPTSNLVRGLEYGG